MDDVGRDAGERNGARIGIVVCDARTVVSEAFAADFARQFPGTRVDIANSPEE